MDKTRPSDRRSPTPRPAHRPAPRTVSPEGTPPRAAVEGLAAELVAEMIHGWRQGRRLLPEDLLVRHPHLWEHPEAALDLIYEELCLRREHGAEVPLEDLLERFPQWRPQLEVLFDCQRLLGPRPAAPQFPAAGDVIGDFRLRSELGRGGQACVFLASQLSLGERAVVLKFAPREVGEHLSLARLQHTHIVPLYSAHEDPARGLRALCMPYFGGATLAYLLDVLRPVPPERRTGQDLAEALGRAAAPEARGGSAPARIALARTSYVRAVCWIGACLADALDYAHARGLVHLDLKPSNVLIAADGQPMLLDFHLAREPIAADGAGPSWLGGTAGYMSPEQHAALVAVARGRPVARAVDGRSDVYALGVLLYEALAGRLPAAGREPGTSSTVRAGTATPRPDPPAPADPPPLWRVNRQVSVGLSDVIGKCLAEGPDDRYRDMAALAGDLRRHLADLPLAGVRNRSVAERWRKWRRRRPHGTALAAMALAVVLAAGAVGLGAMGHFRERTDAARTALSDARRQIAGRRWDEAIATLERGRSALEEVPFSRDLVADVDHELERARQGERAARRVTAERELHRLADRLRFYHGVEDGPRADVPALAAACRSLWQDRRRIVTRLSDRGTAGLAPAVRDDLLDVAIFWADLQARRGSPGDTAAQDSAAALDEAEALFGASPVLAAERRRLGAAAVPPGPPPRTAWECYALARCLLRAGDVDAASAAARHAVALQPQGLWPNFYLGVCAYRRGRHAEAAQAFSVCIGAAPEAAGCFVNRGLARAALGQSDDARRDYDEALRLDPTLAAAALNRGMLHYALHRWADALADLRLAQERGADPAAVAFDRALIHLGQGDRAAALAEVRQTLEHDPHHAAARKLRDELSR